MASKSSLAPKKSNATPKKSKSGESSLWNWVQAAGLDESVRDALVTWLAKQLLSDQYAKLEQGGHLEGGIPLRKVFVDLPIGDQFGAIPSPSPQREYLLASLFSAKTSSLCESDELDSYFDPEEFRPGLQRRPRRPSSGFLVIGGPGQGKSTLGQLACQVHRAALLAPYVDRLALPAQKDVARSFLDPSTKNDIGWPSTILFPLRVELPRAVPWLLEHQEPASKVPALVRWLADEAAQRNVVIAPEALAKLLHHAPFLLVLDGLDEVGATEDRALLTHVVREFLGSFGEGKAKGQVIATTRPQGYAGEFDKLGVSLRTVHLLPLNDKEALQYGGKLAQAKYPNQPDEERRIVKGLEKASKAATTSHLLTTPLQVTIVAALVLQMGEPPAQRWDLFKEYYSTIYKRELERGTYASAILRDYRTQIQLIHGRAGLILQVESEQTGKTRARLSTARLEAIVEAVLVDHEAEERAQLVRRMMRAAQERLVFLVEPEPDQFGFEIRSFQEFMAASALAQDGEELTKTRFLQIARSSMFRAVAVFLASKFFSEGSPLCDVLADGICGVLDEEEEASARVKPGALLALAILEDGSCLKQPGYARALMARACGLLDLPPCAEQLRLAQVASPYAQKVLKEKVAGKLKNPQADEALGAWMVLLQAAQEDAAWVAEVGDPAWAVLEAPSRVLIAFATMAAGRRRVVPKWLLEKLEESTDRVAPSALAFWWGVPTQAETDGKVAAFLHARRNAPGFMQSVGGFGIEIHAVVPNGTWKPLAEWQTPPAPWAPWVWAARFAEAPSAQSLAEALARFAKRPVVEEAAPIAFCFPWPLAACLLSADSSQDLLRFAEMAQRGELGDLQDWCDAEARWHEGVSSDAFLAQVGKRLPWDRNTLADAPPLGGGDMFYAHNAKGGLSVARALGQIRSQALRRHCARLQWSLYANLLQSERAEIQWAEVEEVAIEQGMLPIAMVLRAYREASEKKAWVDGLHRLGLRATVESIYWGMDSDTEPGALSKLYAKYPSATGLLHWIRQIPARSTNADLPPALLKTLHAHPPTDDVSKANAFAIRFRLNDLAPNELPAMLDLLVARAKHDPSLWSTLTDRSGKNPPDARLHQTLLQDMLRRDDVPLNVVRDALASLRHVLGKRESGLINPATWNRLKLPPPLPQGPTHLRSQPSLCDTPVVLASIALQHIRVLADLRLDLAPPTKDKGQWVVLIGPNGVGKTTVLRALALALRDLGNIAIWPSGTFKPDWRSSSAPSTPAIISVTLQSGEMFTTTIQKNGSEKFNAEPSRPAPFPIFAYGCRRGSALGGKDRGVDFGEKEGPEIATLFDDDAPLISASTWLLKWKSDAQDDPSKEPIYCGILKALRSLLDVEEVIMRDEIVVSSEAIGQNIPLSALSDGYLTTAGWFLDLIARYFNMLAQHGSKIEPKVLQDMTGLVLIDELDLHLHPHWQIRVIDKVKELLPKMSFVVTTHNPLTLVGALPEEIWILSAEGGKVSAEQGREAPMLLTGGQIYSRYFGIRDLYPSDIGEALRRYGFLSGDPLRTAEEEAEMQELKKKLQGKGIEPGWEEVPRQEKAKKAKKGAGK